MPSKKNFSLIILLSLLLLSGSVQIVQAEPAPDKLVVNHETKECATIFGGDECMDCLPPEGWEVLGWSYEAECPEGYTFTQVEEICTPFKDEFCCSEGHSGAHGDCEDMVINRVTLKCAFVDDINACNLPLGWQAKPDDTPIYEWACPGLYDWTDDLACQDEPVSDAGDSDSGSGWLPLRCGGSALGGLLLSSVFFFTARRKKSHM
jgi:hypothetical protein